MRGGRVILNLRHGALALLLALAASCGFGPKPDLPPVLPEDLVVGSSEAGGGVLALLYDFAEPVLLTRSATVGSFVLYANIDPAFDGLVDDDPDVPLYALGGEIPLTVELTSIDEGVSVRFDTVVLSAPGDVAEIAMGPGGHFHPEWRITAPEGSTPEPRRVSFRIGDASGGYGVSQTYTLELVVSAP